MLQKLKKRLKEQKGFTLIELLAVIVILGIIAAIAVPAIGNIIHNSRVDAVKADANTVMNSARLYLTENPAATTISETDLEDYLDNTSLDGISITNTAGELTLDAVGHAGDVDITFSDATLEDINADANYDTTNVDFTVPNP